MNKNSFFSIIILILLAAVFLTIMFQKEIKKNYIVLKINNETLRAEVADTFFKRARGLSGRQNLSEKEGMIFVFKKPAIYSFWMRKMNFALDIIWIGEDLKIKEISQNILPQTFPKGIKSSQSIKYVLEVNAGWANEHNIQKGNILSF
jgi:hypothetical protein